jgi:hypothetical protein
MRSSVRLTRVAIRALLGGVAVAALVAASGCGGSSKPAYCSDRAELQKSVQDLKGIVGTSGLSGLQLQLTTVRRNATALADAAKSDFPTETSALNSSVNTLAGAIKALPSSPSSAQIAALALDVSTVVSDVKNLTKATTSACD